MVTLQRNIHNQLIRIGNRLITECCCDEPPLLDCAIPTPFASAPISGKLTLSGYCGIRNRGLETACDCSIYNGEHEMVEGYVFPLPTGLRLGSGPPRNPATSLLVYTSAPKIVPGCWGNQEGNYLAPPGFFGQVTLLWCRSDGGSTGDPAFGYKAWYQVPQGSFERSSIRAIPTYVSPAPGISFSSFCCRNVQAGDEQVPTTITAEFSF